MRLRIYKRKVLALLLALAAAACALALWGGAGGEAKREDRDDRRPPPGGGGGGEQKQQQQPAGPAASSIPGSSSSSSRLRLLLPAPPANASRSPAAAAAASSSSAANGTVLLLRYRSLVYRLNFDQPVRNAERWRAGAAGASSSWSPPWSPSSPPGSPPAVAVVVQVHERAEHLRLLLASLRRARGSERILLVLSHDVWSPELNALAASVDFCAVLQVFFPFSLQLYPDEFPGTDPRDCARDLGQAAALRSGCLNARYPDAFGHYREAAFAQTKHHWWWKLHFVWERVRALRRHPGLVLFLEEDHYLAPDFLHVLGRMWAVRQRHCPECQVLSLGGYAPLRGPLAGRADKLELKTWKSTEHNMGLAFGRDTYEQLMGCAEAFCTYDDYNWDWTLQHLTVSCLPRFWKVLVPEVPRVFHTGDCGMHHKKQCQPAALTAKVDALLEANRQHLFPETMVVAKRYSLAPLSPHVKNGGWGDIRDHELCKSYRRLQ